MNAALREVGAILTAIIGLAIIAVLVSRNANTAGVIQSTFGGLGNAIGAAVGPVTGSQIGSGIGFRTQPLGF